MLTSAPAIYNFSQIDQAVADLDDVIQWSIEHKNRNGYFAALYKNITLRVKAAIQEGQFDDGERMIDFIDVFAGYYIHPHRLYRQGKLPRTDPWYDVFHAGKQKLTVMQHLLLGVNTHINYDLANTSVTICPGTSLLNLCNDYVHINSILHQAVSHVEKDIYSLSPLLSLLSKIFPKLNKKVLNFSLNVSRSKSWECACQQALADPAVRHKVREAAAAMTAELKGKILNPGIFGTGLLMVIKAFEWRSIQETIHILNQKTGA